MALHFDLCVNGEPIGHYVARRTGKVVPGRANTYEVQVSSIEGHRRRTTVRHFYGDGAWKLVLTSLQALAETPDEAIDG